MDQTNDGRSPAERDRLARKGRILYEKSCGTEGPGTCAERFARHHLGRGEPGVARDLLAFLDDRIEALGSGDPQGRREATEDLAARIRAHLREAGLDPNEPSH